MKITEAAAAQVLKSIDQSKNAPGATPGLGLRIAAKRMSDGGIDYAMGLDEPQEADAVYEKHGVQLLISPASADLLDKATLDFVTLDDGNEDFVFHNPLDPNYVAPQE